MPRPLEGQRVLITRASEQVGTLRDRLQSLGAITMEVATIRLAPPSEPEVLNQAAGSLASVDWLIFTSPNGVKFFSEQAHPSTWPQGLRVAAIGPQTAATLENLGKRCDLLPQASHSLGIAEALLAQGDIAHKRLLLPRGDLADGTLPDALRLAGAQVLEVIAYRVLPAAPDQALTRSLAAGEVNWVTILSGSAMKNLLAMLPAPAPLRTVRFASLGPKTSFVIRNLGHSVAAEASERTAEALSKAIVAAHSRT